MNKIRIFNIILIVILFTICIINLFYNNRKLKEGHTVNINIDSNHDVETNGLTDINGNKLSDNSEETNNSQELEQENTQELEEGEENTEELELELEEINQDENIEDDNAPPVSEVNKINSASILSGGEEEEEEQGEQEEGEQEEE